MTDKLRQILRGKLVETLEATDVTPRSSLDLLVERSPETTDEAQAEAIESERIDEWELRVQVGQQARRALARMDAGEYGLCEDCGAPIAQRRLEALPWAEYCLTCQENHEVRASGSAGMLRDMGHFHRLEDAQDLPLG